MQSPWQTGFHDQREDYDLRSTSAPPPETSFLFGGGTPGSTRRRQDGLDVSIKCGRIALLRGLLVLPFLIPFLSYYIAFILSVDSRFFICRVRGSAAAVVSVRCTRIDHNTGCSFRCFQPFNRQPPITSSPRIRCSRFSCAIVIVIGV